MSTPPTPTGGVKAFSIAGSLMRKRDRLAGMTDDERRWRAQWLKDQALSAEEPKYVPEYYKATNNIFRRIWQFPANQFETILTPVLGKSGANLARLCSAAGMKFIMSIYVLGYILKYHSNDFTSYRCIETWCSRMKMYPDEPDFPNFPRRTVEDFYDIGFYSSVLCVDVPPPPPPPPPPPIELPDACAGMDSTE